MVYSNIFEDLGNNAQKYFVLVKHSFATEKYPEKTEIYILGFITRMDLGRNELHKIFLK